MRRIRVDVASVLLGVVIGTVLGWIVAPEAAGVLDHQVPSADAEIRVRSTSEPSPTSTTSTTATTTRTAPTPPASGPDRGEKTPQGVVVAVAELRSTSYCLTGRMASGRPTYVGAVASNRFPLGTRVRAWPNPWGDSGMVFTVEDRHARSDGDGYPTEFDFAMPGECDRALAWGNRQFVTVETVG